MPYILTSDLLFYLNLPYVKTSRASGFSAVSVQSCMSYEFHLWNLFLSSITLFYLWLLLKFISWLFKVIVAKLWPFESLMARVDRFFGILRIINLANFNG